MRHLTREEFKVLIRSFRHMSLANDSGLGDTSPALRASMGSLMFPLLGFAPGGFQFVNTGEGIATTPMLHHPPTAFAEYNNSHRATQFFAFARILTQIDWQVRKCYAIKGANTGFGRFPCGNWMDLGNF